ncbi:hypothetical protein 7841G3A7_3 [Haloquadratum phage sp.]|nr:hypothetical protein 7841G3A7_3 [Haloquadratum phage sp.]
MFRVACVDALSGLVFREAIAMSEKCSNQSVISNPPTPSSVNYLELSRERSRDQINQFLNRVHPRGEVAGWKACFGARYQAHLVACLVVGRPNSKYSDDGQTLEINRFGIRDDRPANTGSWLISRAVQWAELEGFDTIITFAGVSGEKGTVYRASGFELIDTTMSDGSSWTYRDDRDSWSDYKRRKYQLQLDSAEVYGE